MKTSLINVLVNKHLPEDLRSLDRVYDKRGVESLMTEVARNYPDQYSRISQAIGDIGRKLAYQQGETFVLSDFEPPFDRSEIFSKLDAEERELRNTVSDPDELEAKLGDLYGRYSEIINKRTGEEAIRRRNNIALTVLSGARGKIPQLSGLVSSPGFYADSRGRVAGGFVRRSFAEGLSPFDYLAGAYGAREAVTGAKRCLSEGTLVRMADGSCKPIEAIVPGDFVVGANRSGRTKPAEVVRVFDQGIQEVEDFYFTPSNSRHSELWLRCTSSHKVLSTDPGAYDKDGRRFKKGRIEPLSSLVDRRDGVTKPAEPVGPHVPGVKGKPLASEVVLMSVKDSDPYPKASLKRMEPAGRARCWDIEVANEDHLFVLANGLIVSNSTAKGGFFAKTLSRVNLSNYVSTDDCQTSNGLDLSVEEPDIRGRVLQRDAAGFPAGTVITRDVLKRLKKNEQEVIVRSPMTCQAENGICSKCFGVTAEGRLPRIGEHVGITASTALGEPLVQSSLNSKHVTSAKGGKQEFSGLDYIQQFVESPEEFKDRSIVAEEEGLVEDIREAPQGGSYIRVSGREHYVPPDRKIQVEVGKTVEAGDQLTDGLVDPEDVVRLKGLGAGRRYYAERLSEIASASGAGMDRRLFETIARSAIDHVELDDPVEEGFLPDDVVSYSKFVHRRSIPSKVQRLTTHKAIGKYLQAPALHHTVGTKITRSMAEMLEAKGFKELQVSDEEVPFRPKMIRLQQAASLNDDWLARMGGSNLGRGLEDSRTRALDTNIEENTHPVPRLAVTTDFAKNLHRTGKF